MPLSQSLKDTAALLGFHVVRNYQNPAHTLMGLKRFDIRTVLDVGANSGQFARYIRKHLPNATLHCFEPIPEVFGVLDAWARGQQGIIATQLALGAESGSAEMNVHSAHSSSSSLLATSPLSAELYPFTVSQTRISVRVDRLDDYVRRLERPLTNDILLKLDVQGFEAAVLRGAPVTLAEVRACIVEVSTVPLYDLQSTFKEIHDLMSATGLSYAGNFSQVYAADGRVLFLDAVFVRN